MATPTYEQITRTVLGSTANSVTLSSIPNTYRDIIAVVEHQTSGAEAGLYVKFNSSGSGYQQVVLDTNGSVVYYGDTTGSYITFTWAIGSVSTTHKGICTLEVFDYAKTDRYKLSINRNGQTDMQSFYSVNSWNSTSAINSMTFELTSAREFVVGSTFTLWGVAA